MQTCRICDSHSADELRYCGACGEPLRDDVPAKARPRISKVLPAGTAIGSYRLLEVIGEGGMGRVYLAEHIRLGRRVALKMLRSKYSQNPESVKRFFTEARAVNRIAHENIVEVTDFVSEPDGTSFYIMELLNGSSLFDVLHHERVLPLRRALDIAGQVANALAAVHDAGIVHRDLKPDNIFLARRGNREDLVKLLDFGIAKLVEPDTDVSIQRTGVGTLMGTPAYMSPEQASAGPVDYRSDIYSLGVILYELVTGVVPFEASNYGEILVQHLTKTPRRPSTLENLRYPIPTELEKLILHCLGKAPESRPQSMREVEERLRAVVDAQNRGEVMLSGPTWPSMAAVAPPEGPVELDTAERTPGRRRWRALTIGAAALALAGGGAAAWFFLGERPTEESGQGARVPEESPPPPPAAVTPPAAPQPATTVGLRVESTPAGADVYVAGTDAPIGQTPLVTRIARSAEPVVLEIRKPGFAPVSQTMTPAEDVIISAALRAAETSAATPAEPPSAGPGRRRPGDPPRRDKNRDKRIEKDGVIDAFEQ